MALAYKEGYKQMALAYKEGYKQKALANKGYKQNIP